MRRSDTPPAAHEMRTLHTDLSHAVFKARRRRRILRWTLVGAALVLALCLVVVGNPI